MDAFVTNFDAKEKIWSGRTVSESTFHPDISAGKIALFMMQKFPGSNVAQISDRSGKKFTSAEMYMMSVRVAQHLQKLGLKQKDVIGIAASNTEFVAPLVIGAFAAGVIISPVHPSFNNADMKHIYGTTRPKLMFCDGEILGTVKKVVEELKLNCPIYTMKDHKQGTQRVEELIQPTGNELSYVSAKLEDGGDQTAAILCSSGTTGLPKGVCISHRAMAIRASMAVRADDVTLSFSGIDWSSGIGMLISSIVNGSTRIITDEPFSPELFLRLIEQYRVTVVFGNPSQMAMTVNCPDIEKRDLSSVVAFLCGGSAVPLPVLVKMKEYIPKGLLVCGFGMTEIFANCSAGVAKAQGDNGKLGPNIKLKIIDENGNKLGTCETGELCFKTNLKWAGYYGNPEATKTILHEDGWIHSGDLGYVDENGVLFVVDRKKEILKYKGFHYAPSDIEQAIAEIPDVIEVCVCGIPDVVAYDLPAAAIVKRSGSKLNEEEVCDYVAKRLTHYKHLTGGVHFVDCIPKTSSGKNIRRLVKEMILKKKESAGALKIY